MNPHAESFRDAIRAAGIDPPDVIEPTNGARFKRFSSSGKRSDDAGWYTFHDDGIPAGAFGCWRTGINGVWSAKPDKQQTPAERQAIAKRAGAARAAAEAEQRGRQAQAREQAGEIWSRCHPIPEDHQYLTAKGIRAAGMRLYQGPLSIGGMKCDGCIVVPLRDTAGALHTLEFISVDGEKRFLPNGAKAGHYFALPGGDPANAIIIAEGAATAASISEATGTATAAAIDAGNLKPVALALRAKYPETMIIVAGDDDALAVCAKHKAEGATAAVPPTPLRPEWCKCNPGHSRAIEAAQAVNGAVALPVFTQAEREAGNTDFNDLAQTRPDAIRKQLDAVKIETATPNASGINYRRMSSIEAKPIEWLWPGRFARGKVSMIAGHPGLGKSQITASLAAIVSRGGTWPVDRARATRGNVIFLSAEDEPSDTIRPRLEAAGADLDRIYMLDAVRDEGRDGEPTQRGFSLKSDLSRLGAMLGEIGDVSLIIIDPITAYMGGVETHYNADVRAALAPLSDLAAEHRAAVVCVSHLNKGGGGGSEALMRVTGSIAFVAAARAAYLVVRDEEDAQRRLFLPLKNNVGSDQNGLAFELQPFKIPSGIDTCRVMWESQAVTVTADQALASQIGDRSKTDEAKDYLLTALKSEMGANIEVPSLDVEQGARAHGISEGTLRIAKKALGVKAIKRGQPNKPEAPGKWYLKLPEYGPEGAKNPEDAKTIALAPSGKLAPSDGKNETDPDAVVI